jgi:hypothetical protein
MKQPYVVLEQINKFSKYGTPMVQITMVGVKDRKEYITYIDKPNRNYKNWQHIIRHSDHGFVLGNCEIKRHKEKLLINADSDPIIEWEAENPNDIMDQLQAIWAEDDRKAAAGTFRDLFN